MVSGELQHLQDRLSINSIFPIEILETIIHPRRLRVMRDKAGFVLERALVCKLWLHISRKWWFDHLALQQFNRKAAISSLCNPRSSIVSYVQNLHIYGYDVTNLEDPTWLREYTIFPPFNSVLDLRLVGMKWSDLDCEVQKGLTSIIRKLYRLELASITFLTHEQEFR